MYTQEDQEKRSKLAGYLAHGILPAQAAIAVGYTPARVTQLLQDDEEFIALCAEKEQALTTESLDIDSQYNELERMALTNLKKAMDLSYDPDMAYRIAMLANKAVRRSNNKFGPQQHPINGGKQNVVQISLSVGYIERKQSGADVIEGEAVDLTDVENVATPDQIEHMMASITDMTGIGKKKAVFRLDIDGDD